jgi:excisionase family DNA binding protein
MNKRTSVTLVEAAEALGLNPSTLRVQIRNGRLKAQKIGTAWFVTGAEIERYREQSLGNAGRPKGTA